jgi:Sortilin, neurotensin receptor 3,
MSARIRPWWVALLGLVIVTALAAPANTAAASPANPAAAARAADDPGADDPGEPPDCDEDEPAPAAVQADEDDEDPLCTPEAPGEWKANQDISGGVGLPERALLRAAEQARGLGGDGPAWTAEGPTNIGGRVTGVAVDPQQAGTVYAAAASGGVWKSTDQGATYQPSWPATFPQATGAIAAGRDGAIYVGTGEANPGGGSMTYEGDGVYRSTDHGAHWRHLGLSGAATIGAIAVDPTNPQRVYVAATGSVFRDDGQRGVDRSTDGGAHWKLVLAGATPATGAVDVQIDPTNPSRIFASMWDRRRVPNLRTYAGVGSGLYRSTDGGSHWQRLQNVTSLAPGDTVGLTSAPTLGRIGIGVSATIPGRVYVITATYRPFGDELGFYRSDDAGDSFAAATKAGAGGDIWWTGKVWVDPADGNHLFVPGVNLRESIDGGTTWRNTTGMHVDHHAMAWDPKVPGRVYEGNDGGAYRSDANGATGTWVKGTVEPWSQFYSVAVSAQDPTRISGGLQDNGSVRTWGGVPWNSFGGGDGEQNLINPVNQDIVFNCSQFGACRRSVNGGTNFQGLAGRVADRYNWFAPLEFAADDPSVVYSGGNILNRSTNGGQTYTPISPDLSGGPGPDPVYPFGTLTTVGSSRTDPSEIVAGTDDGRVVLTRDLGTTWTVLRTGGQWVTRVKVDPTNPGRIWVTLSGYRAGTGDGHVLVTDNRGRSWRDVTGRLPNAPVNDVVIGPGRAVYVATDVGVFRSTDADRNWTRVGAGLPLAAVTDIEYNTTSGRLFAATFGRGVYSLPITAES